MENILEDSTRPDYRSVRCRRELFEFLEHRLGLLNGPDRALMKMYLQGESSVRQIGKLMKIGHVTLARRINRITRRLMNQQYAA